MRRARSPVAAWAIRSQTTPIAPRCQRTRPVAWPAWTSSGTVDIITTWGDHPEHHRRLAKANTEIGATCLAAVPDAAPAPSGPGGGGGLDVIELVGVGPTTDTIELSWGDWIAAASVEGNEYIEGQAYVFVVDLHGYENGGTVQIANEVASDTITSQALRVGRDIAAGPVLVVVTVAEGARWAVLLTRV